MANVSPELPPRTDPEDVITWFREHYQHADVEEHVTYLRAIMNVRFRNLDHYHVGNYIVRGPGEWKVTAPNDVKAYASNFTPKFTPDVLLRFGIFGGLAIQGIEAEIPIEWVIYALLERKLLIDKELPDQTKNYFQIIAEPYPLPTTKDARAFFHWFCRYHLGKRDPEDIAMINQWRKHAKMAQALFDSKVTQSLVTRQMLLQWSLTS
jgi:hypothetical protein